MPLNLHKVFSGSKDSDYISSLSVDQDKETQLREARDSIRSVLRSALGNLTQFAGLTLFESAALARNSLRPKFRMQGSFSYRTCNDPASKPPQQVDLDDGMFVPISYLHSNGRGSQPALLSRGLFEVVERAITPLCKVSGWKIERKPSCVRVIISDDAHVDLALYSIPDAEFSTLVEKAQMAQDAGVRASEAALASDELPESLYRLLASSQIMLAHRAEGWKPSDPRKLEDWFRDAVKEHGEHLRRVCRYLKGWRDHFWLECRLSSIVLMAAAVEAFKQDAQLRTMNNRDDLALLGVCEKLPAILRQGIANPVVAGLRLDEGWSPNMRAEFVEAAEKLYRYVRSAISTRNAQIALGELREGFGDRIPQDGLHPVPKTPGLV